MSISGFSRSFLIMALLLSSAACGSEKAGGGKATSGKSASPAAVAAQPGADWLSMIEKTSEGGYRIGNPNARVQLVEFASLTCPHCGEFHEKAMPILKRDYIAKGLVSYELRTYVRDPADYAAAMLSRCQSPVAFFGHVDGFFDSQRDWGQKLGKMSEDFQKQINTASPQQRVTMLARYLGFDARVKARGIGEKRFEQCLTDRKLDAEISEIRNQADVIYKISGTPSFLINGELQNNVFSWETLKPLLDSAL